MTGGAGRAGAAGTRIRVAAAVILALALTLGTSALSRVPVALSGPEEALVRLSWRADGVTVEACRERTEEELARLPVHMRNPLACIGELAPYELRVEVDGRTVRTDTLRPAGARGDRPVFVYAEVPVAPGLHRARVSFRALVPDGFNPPEGIRDLEWAGDVDLGPREIVLVTTEPGGDGLELARPEGRRP